MTWMPLEEAKKSFEFYRNLEIEVMKHWGIAKQREKKKRDYYIAYIKVGQTTKVAAIDRVTGAAYKLSETGYYVPTYEKWKTWTLIRGFRSMDF
jgi:hypothetical protein